MCVVKFSVWPMVSSLCNSRTQLTPPGWAGGAAEAAGQDGSRRAMHHGGVREHAFAGAVDLHRVICWEDRTCSSYQEIQQGQLDLWSRRRKSQMRFAYSRTATGTTSCTWKCCSSPMAWQWTSRERCRPPGAQAATRYLTEKFQMWPRIAKSGAWGRQHQPDILKDITKSVRSLKEIKSGVLTGVPGGAAPGERAGHALWGPCNAAQGVICHTDHSHCPPVCRAPTASPGSCTRCQEQLFSGIHGVRWRRSRAASSSSPRWPAPPYLSWRPVSVLWPHRRPENPQGWAASPSWGFVWPLSVRPKGVFADTSTLGRVRWRHANAEAWRKASPLHSFLDNSWSRTCSAMIARSIQPGFLKIPRERRARGRAAPPMGFRGTLGPTCQS